MGSEVSKPAEASAAKAAARANHFQIISPVSDISNPSEFRRRGPPLHAGHSAHERRRASKVVTTALSKPPRDVPAPQAFYFPTRESEKYSEKLSAGRSPERETERYAKNKNDTRYQARAKGKWNIGKNRLRKKNAKMMGPHTAGRENHGEAIGKDRTKPRSKLLNRQRKDRNNVSEGEVVLATLDNKKNQNRAMYHDSKENVLHSENHDIGKEKFDHQNRDSKGRIVERKMKSTYPKKHKHTHPSQEWLASKEAQSFQLPNSLVPKEEKRPSLDNHESTPLQDLGTLGGVGLHHEDEYFDRLALGSCVTNGSPFVHGEAAAILAQAPILGHSSSLENSTNDTPVITHHDQEVSPPSIYYKSSATQTSEEVAIGSDLSTDNKPVGMEPAPQSLAKQAIPPGENNLDESDSVELFLDEDSDGSIHDKVDPVRANKRDHSNGNNGHGTFDSQAGQESFSKKSGRSSGVNAVSCDENLDPQDPIEETSVKVLDNLASPLSDDDDTYFKPSEKANSDSVFRKSVAAALPKEPIKQIASLGPSCKGNGSEKRSKLESLFRPILPSLSDSDARASLGSFDPYEIKVTESAPSVIESSDYRAIALPPQFGSPGVFGQKASIVPAGQSPSMMSIDSQVVGTPSSVRPMVSDQAICNAQFLFTTDYQRKTLPQSSKTRRDSSIFSISTLGARSRLSRRSARSQTVTIPVSALQSETSSLSSQELKRVRFSGDEKSSYKHELSTSNKPVSFKKTLVKDIVVPDIERNVSDLTDTLGDLDVRSSVGSSKSEPKQETIPEETSPESVSPQMKTSIDEQPSVQDENTAKSQSPEARRVQWSYREEGNLSAVTPHLKGKRITNATNSPFIRFKAAKTKFSNTTDKIVPVRKSSPVKVKSKSGGIVSTRINELNKRVSEARRERKKRHSSAGASSKCEPTNMIRTPVILNYNPNAIGAGRFTLKIHEGDDSSVVSDNSIDESLDQNRNQHPPTVVTASPEESRCESLLNRSSCAIGECDTNQNFLRLSMESSSVATVRVVKESHEDVHRCVTRPSTGSVDTFSTASSGLTRVRKQVFRRQSRGSGQPRTSLSSSDGESTTLSSIIDKENSTYLPFRTGAKTVKPAEQQDHTAKQSLHLSPTQRTPAQARKWRSLAAAAQEKNINRGAVGRGLGRQRKGLSMRDTNQMNVYGH